MAQPTGRKLAAVMFTDVVGFGRLADRDERLALHLVEEHQRILRQLFPQFGGKEIKSTGDGFFCEFSSVVDAVNCAIAIQTTLFERNLSVEIERKLQIRIGIHLGDVFDLQEDRYGNEVNIAARIEPFARPGGICISQQVYDQVSTKIDFPFKKIGRIRLKNIAAPVTLFGIVFPWEEKAGLLLRKVATRLVPQGPRTARGVFLASQIFGTIALLAFIALRLGHPVSLVVDRGPIRSIASGASARELLLPSEWTFASGSDAVPGIAWTAFDTARPMDYADRIQGDYLMKLEFTGAGGFRHPAMVLGLVSDVHRLYLNGHFIGGSERFADISAYSFDPSLIRPGEKNTILIKAKTRPSYSPGLNVFSGLEPKIGEFEDISRQVSEHEVSFHYLRPIALAIALVLAFASLLYCVFSRASLKYLYYSSFLFLGALCLTYYNTFVVASVSYPFYRFVKLLALGLSSSVLFSIYLHGRGLRRLETANAFFGLVFGGVAAGLLVFRTALPSQYIASEHLLCVGALGYTFFWMGLLAIRGVYKFGNFVELKKLTRSQVVDVALVTSFGTVIGLLCFMSAFHVASSALKSLALLYPFAFAIIVLSIGVSDYTQKSYEISYKRRKDDLILSISQIVGSASDRVETIAAIQNRVTEFLGASRSTIYLLEKGASEGSLRAIYIHGPVGSTVRVKKLIERPEGILGYCLEHRSPVFVKDIQTDSRFQSMSNSQEDGTPGFKSGSFMLFPLIVAARLVGVITIADRKDAQPFTREDFSLMHLVAKDLALLVSHPRITESFSDSVDPQAA